MTDTPAKRTRQVMTVTAMIEACNELFFATLEDGASIHRRPCTVELELFYNKEDVMEYRATLIENMLYADGVIKRNFIHKAERPDSFEQALSAVLNELEKRIEEKRQSLLSELKVVTDRHRSILKGARQRTRTKKE